MQGLCTGMCPPNEIIMRQKNSLIHPLETDNPWNLKSSVINLTKKNLELNKKKLLIGNSSKMVKAYSRSAADKKIIPDDVRPFEVLNISTDYLLKQIISSDLNSENIHKRWPIIYEFIIDRFRAIRQDIVVQQLTDKQIIEILEKMIPFYLIAAYLFEVDGTPSICFDKKKTMHCFDQKLHFNELKDCFSKWKYIDDKTGLGSKRIKAAYLLRHCNNSESLTLFLQWKNQLEADNGKKFAQQIYTILLSYRLNNFIAFFRVYSNLDYLLSCTLIPFVAEIRLSSLNIIFLAYNAPNIILDIKTLSKWLNFNSFNDLYSCINELFYKTNLVENDNQKNNDFIKMNSLKLKSNKLNQLNNKDSFYLYNQNFCSYWFRTKNINCLKLINYFLCDLTNSLN